MRKRQHLVILIAAFLFAGTGALKAQEVDYKFHTVFMYNFTKYIKWPEASLGNEFVIGVLGNSAITGHLQKMAQSKTVSGKPIVVKSYNSAAEISGCHMLFLPLANSSQLPSLRQTLGNKPTLIVSEKEGLGKQGSDVNFVITNGRWNFELNQASAELRNLKVSGELTKFAHKIYTEI